MLVKIFGTQVEVILLLYLYCFMMSLESLSSCALMRLNCMSINLILHYLFESLISSNTKYAIGLSIKSI